MLKVYEVERDGKTLELYVSPGGAMLFLDIPCTRAIKYSFSGYPKRLVEALRNRGGAYEDSPRGIWMTLKRDGSRGDLLFEILDEKNPIVNGREQIAIPITETEAEKLAQTIDDFMTVGAG